MRARIVVIVVALALGVSSCGGASSSPPRTEAKSTNKLISEHKQTSVRQMGGPFATRAEAVCSQIAAITRATPAKRKDAAGFIQRLAAGQDMKIAALKAITPPEALKVEYNKWLGVIAQRLKMLGGLPVTGANKQGQKSATKKFADLGAQETRLIAAMHLRACGSQVSSSG